MLDSRIMAVLIASDDHRLLSANAEAWWLAQNDVFVPFESFLTEESQAEFMDRLSARNGGWFLVFFQKQPEIPYLTRFAFDAPNLNDSVIQIILTRLDELMDNYRLANQSLGVYDSMLSLYEDLFFEYDRDSDTLTLYNTDQSAYHPGAVHLDDYTGLLSARCSQEARPSLSSLIAHLRNGTPRFRLNVPCNLFNDDPAIQSVQFKGITTRHRNDRKTLVGIMHPLRTRGAEEQEITYDALTGVVSKEHITRLAEDRINRRHAEHSAIAILDVDYFKHINDNYGHQHGDHLLRQLAGIMETELKDGGIVGRIGGDEFLILFYHVETETDIRAYLRSIKSVISAMLPGVTVSIGAACYPYSAQNYSDLFQVADWCLYRAKAKGRNRYIIHTLEKHPPLEQIKVEQTGGERNLVRGREDLPLGDALVQIQYMMRYGKRPPLTTVIGEFAVRASVPLLTLFREKDKALLAVGGKEKNDADALTAFLKDHEIRELTIPRNQVDGMTVTHTVDKKEEGEVELREALLAHGILSYIYIPFRDAEGRSLALIFASVNRKVFWNEEHLKYFRLFADLLSECPPGSD